MVGELAYHCLVMRVHEIADSIKVVAAVLALGTIGASDVGPALARGGAPNIMDSPGYQRRLQESRQQLGAPYTVPPAAYPRQTLQRKHWQHHRKRQHRR